MFLTCVLLSLLGVPTSGKGLTRRETRRSLLIDHSGTVFSSDDTPNAKDLPTKHPELQGSISTFKQESKQGYWSRSRNCSGDADANAALLFKTPLPSTWADAKQRQLTKCLSMYDNSVCSGVVEQLHKDQPTGTASFVPGNRFCEESCDLFQAAELQQTNAESMLGLSDPGEKTSKLSRPARQPPKSGGVCNICTALFLAGRLPAEIWTADDNVGHEMQVSWIGRAILRGYQLWSRPLAKMMLQSSFLLNLLEPLAGGWAKTMAWLGGSAHPEAQLHILAIIETIIGLPICFLVGLICEFPMMAVLMAVGLYIGLASYHRVKV